MRCMRADLGCAWRNKMGVMVVMGVGVRMEGGKEECDAGEKSSAAWERRELLLGVNCAKELIVMVVNAGLTQTEDS